MARYFAYFLALTTVCAGILPATAAEGPVLSSTDRQAPSYSGTFPFNGVSYASFQALLDNPGDDTDSDGFTDLQEFLAGSDDADAQSVPEPLIEVDVNGYPTLPAGSPDLAFLSPTLEVTFTKELAALAAELEYNPAKIYHWVYQNITFEDYTLSRKTAQTVFRTKRGNEWDQCTLLITLLRMSGIPSSYVWGPDYQERQLTDSSWAKGRFVCVNAWVDAAIYRGAASQRDIEVGDWFPLVPWFKSIKFEQGIDLFPVSDETQWKHYEIPAGTFFTGDMHYLVFGADDDANSPGVADTQVRDVRISGGRNVTLPATGVQPYTVYDTGGEAFVENDGKSLRLEGNAFKKIAFDYKVTANTVIEFDFKSTNEGESHGIGFEKDDALTWGYLFELYGTRRNGSENKQYLNYAPTGDNGDGWKHYRIEVGSAAYAGIGETMTHLTFVLDDDAVGEDGHSEYANIRVYESDVDDVTIDFSVTPPTNHEGASQNPSGTVEVKDGGRTIHLNGSRWQRIDLPVGFTVTENTVLEFDFRSDSKVEVHGVGFDTNADNNLSSEYFFKVYGTQDWGIKDYEDYAQKSIDIPEELDLREEYLSPTAPGDDQDPDYEENLAAFDAHTQKTSVELFQDKMIDYLKKYHPGKSISDVGFTERIVGRSSMYLPSSFPSDLVLVDSGTHTVTSNYDVERRIPEAQRRYVDLQFKLFPPQSLLGRWRYDEDGSQTSKDTGRHLNHVNRKEDTVKFATLDNTNQKVGNGCHYYDGDAVTVAWDHSSFTERTVMLWFKRTESGSGIKMLYEAGKLSQGMAIWLEDTGATETVSMKVYGGPGQSADTTTMTLQTSADGWHHVAAVYKPDPDDPDKGVMQLFLDGVAGEVEKRATGLTVLTHDYGAVGAARKGSVYANTDGQLVFYGFTGYIDEVRIYDEALSEESIKYFAIDIPEEDYNTKLDSPATHNSYPTQVSKYLFPEKTVYFAQISGRRLALEFRDSQYQLSDSTLIDSKRPMLTVDGTTILAQGTVDVNGYVDQYLGSHDGFETRYKHTNWGAYKSRPEIRVGAHLNLNFDPLAASHEQVVEHEKALVNATTRLAFSDNEEEQEQFFGQYAALMSSNYLYRARQARDLVAPLMGIRVGDENTTFSVLMWTYPDDAAGKYSSTVSTFLLMNNWRIDAISASTSWYKAGTLPVVDISLDDSSNFIGRLIGDVHSVQESEVFEDWQQTPSLSTVAAIFAAVKEGVSVVRLTAENVDGDRVWYLDSNGTQKYLDEEDEAFRYSLSFIAGVKKDLEEGKIVTLPVQTVPIKFPGTEDVAISADVKLVEEDGEISWAFNQFNGGGSSNYVSQTAQSASVYHKIFSAAANSYSTNNKVDNGSVSIFSWMRPRWNERAKIGVGDPVDIVTGEFYHEELPDISIPSRGLALEVRRTYKNQLNYDGIFGIGWTWNHAEEIIVGGEPDDEGELPTGSFTYYDAERRRYDIKPDGGNYSYPAGTTFKLEISGTVGSGSEEYHIIHKNQIRFIFDDAGKLIRKQDTFGNFIEFDYDQDDRMTAFRDALGQQITLNYTGNAEQVSSISDFLGRSVTYTYEDTVFKEAVDDDLLGDVNVELDAGYDTLTLKGNRWQKMAVSQVVSATTQIYFQFRGDSDKEGDLHGIGLATGDDLESSQFIKVFGQQEWGGASVTQHSGNGITWTPYQVYAKDYVPIGQTITGLVFAVDGDGVYSQAQSEFRIVRILEGGTTEFDLSAEPLTNYTTTHEEIIAKDLIKVTDLEGNDTTYTYYKDQENPNNNHNIKRVTLNNGDYLDVFYYKNDKVSHHTNKLGKTFHFQFSDTNRYAETWNEEGYYYKAFWNDNGDVIRIENEAGEVTRRTFDDEHNMIEEIDGNGNKRLFEYDTARNLTKRTVVLGEVDAFATDPADPADLVWDYEYDSTFNEVTKATDPRGTVTESDLDSQTGSLLEVRAAAALGAGVPETATRVTRFEYDAHGNLITKTESPELAEARATRYGYDHLGIHQTSVQNPANGPNELVQMVYDDAGRQIRLIDREGNVEAFAYNEYNQVTKQTNALGHTTTNQYDALRRITDVIAPDGATLHTDYQTARDLVDNALVSAVTDPLGEVARQEYDAVGNVIRRTDKRGYVTEIRYDGLQRPIEMIDANGDSIHYKYDQAGNQIAVTDRRGNTKTMEYDDANRLIKEVDPAGKTSRYLYDANSNRTHIIQEITGNENYYVERYEYDGHNQLVRTILGAASPGSIDDPEDARITEYFYDSLGQLVRVRDALDNEVRSTFDGNGNKTSEKFYDADDQLLKTITYEYNARDQLIKMTDARGKVWQYEYDAAGRQTAQVNPLGHRVETDYDSRNNVIQVATRVNGTIIRRTRHTYNKRNEKISDTDALGHVWGCEYDEDGRKITAIDPQANETRTFYDALGRRIGSQDALGNTVTWDYDAEGNLLGETTPKGERTRYFYDVRNLLTQKTNALNDDWTYDYDILGRQIGVTDALNFESTIVYNRFDEVIETIDPVSNSAKSIYDKLGRVIEAIDARGVRVLTEYDALGRVIETIVAPGEAEQVITRYSYDPNDNLTEQIEAYGEAEQLTTQYTYDDLNRLTQTTVGMELLVADRLVSTVQYDDENREIVTTDAHGVETTVAYDLIGQKVSETNSDNKTHTWTYDSRRLVTKITPPADGGLEDSPIEYQYDAAGRLTLTKQGVDERSTEYDANSRVSKEYDFLAVETTYDYDKLGRLVKTIEGANNNVGDADYAQTLYEYDAVSSLTKITNANGNAVTYEYDGLRRRTKEIDADGVTYQQVLAYDPNSNIQSLRLRDGKVIDYTYDLLDRVTEVRAGGTLQQTFRYDTLSRMTLAVDHNADGRMSSSAKTYAVEYKYDLFGRTTEESLSDSDTLDGQGHLSSALTSTLTYEDHPVTAGISRRTTAAFAGGRRVEREWDDVGRLSAVKDPDASRTHASYTYLANDRIKSCTLGPTGGGNVDTVLSHTYDSRGREDQREYKRSGTTVLYKLDTVCDAQSRVIDEDNSGTAVHDPFNRGYSYDDLNRLLARDEDDNATDDITWSYDKVGNWTGSNQNTGIGGATETFTSNEDNEYTAAGSLTDLAYDDLGNLIEATDDDGQWRYVYDWSNRLVEVHRRDSQVGYWQLHASYYYDAVNRRVEKSVGSINPVSTWYICLGSQVVEERAGISLLISDVLRSFVYGQSADDVICMVAEASGGGGSGGTFYYYLLDRIGSVVGLLSDSGSVLEKYDYSEFGSMTIRDSGGVVRHGGSQYGNPYGYTGRRYDAETGLWYYRNRMYDARMGRFLQRDPAGYVDGVNLYAYVSNSPLVFNDPSGLTARSPQRSGNSTINDFGLRSQSFNQSLAASGSALIHGSNALYAASNPLGAYSMGIAAERLARSQRYAVGDYRTDEEVADEIHRRISYQIQIREKYAQEAIGEHINRLGSGFLALGNQAQIKQISDIRLMYGLAPKRHLSPIMETNQTAMTIAYTIAHADARVTSMAKTVHLYGRAATGDTRALREVGSRWSQHIDDVDRIHQRDGLLSAFGYAATSWIGLDAGYNAITGRDWVSQRSLDGYEQWGAAFQTFGTVGSVVAGGSIVAGASGATSAVGTGITRAGMYGAARSFAAEQVGLGGSGATRGGLPQGITFEGTVHRAVNPKYADSAFDFHAPSNLAANHRYSGIGRGGIYSGTSREAVLGELAHYKIDPNNVAWVTKDIRISNVLDLTNPAVRKQLGVSLKDITGDSYLYTQGIGDLVRSRGYNGILFPAARARGTTNFVELVNHAD